jgi:hypothetical protein
MAVHAIEGCTCDEREVDLLYIPPERFRAAPQVGIPCRMPWQSLAVYLSRPSVGDEKDEAGAWSPAVYTDNVRRKANLVSIGALVIDVDESGDVDDVAEAVSKYACVVHETFSSTNDAPRCRLVMQLAAPVDAGTYETLHAIVRHRLSGAGIIADQAAKDASRVSYSPVRRSGAGYRFRVTHGRALHAEHVIAAHRRRLEPALPPPRATDRTGDRYLDAALQRECAAVLNAGQGARNNTLNKAAHSLARLNISDDRIEADLLDVAKRAGLSEHEARKTIASGLRARRATR